MKPSPESVEKARESIPDSLLEIGEELIRADWEALRNNIATALDEAVEGQIRKDAEIAKNVGLDFPQIRFEQQACRETAWRIEEAILNQFKEKI